MVVYIRHSGWVDGWERGGEEAINHSRTVIVATVGMTAANSRPSLGLSLKRRIVPTTASRTARRPLSRWRFPYRMSGVGGWVGGWLGGEGRGGWLE